MNRIIILLFSLILFILPAFGQDLNTDLNRKFKKHSLTQLDSQAILKKVDKNEAALIETFLVYLDTNHLFSNRLIASETPATVKPVPDDYTGDGKADMAFWRPSTGFWFVLRSENFSFYSFPFGQNGDIPTSADFNGDNRADYVIYREGVGCGNPHCNTWYIQYSSSSATTIHQLGMSGDIPVPADYDGDGLADLATFRPIEQIPGETAKEGYWYFVNTSVKFGNKDDIPIPGFLVVQ